MNRHTNSLHPPQSVAELLGLYDEEFVRSAYLSILGRPADLSGLSEYLQQVRLGMDKRKLLVVLATSAEGAGSRAIDRLPGLRELIIQMESEQRSFISRLVNRWMSNALRPLSVQVEACGHRVAILTEVMQDRLDRLEAAVQALPVADKSAIADPKELAELKHMTLHARQIYFLLKDAAAKASRTSV